VINPNFLSFKRQNLYSFWQLLKDLKSLGDKGLDLGVINPGLIKFGSRKYYRYVGSLTTPPCTEGVVWTIVKKVLYFYMLFLTN